MPRLPLTLAAGFAGFLAFVRLRGKPVDEPDFCGWYDTRDDPPNDLADGDIVHLPDGLRP